MTSENRDEEREKSVALERYGYVLNYLAYENTAYWNRIGFVIAAQGALIAFGAGQVLEVQKGHSPFAAMVAFGLGILAVALCLLGLRMVKGSLRWIYHWHAILRELEPNAYGDIELLRDAKRITHGEHNYSVREVANHVMYLFIVAWIALLALLAGFLACR